MHRNKSSTLMYILSHVLNTFEHANTWQSDYNGPFIFWAVDEPDIEEDGEDADSEDE